MSQPVLLRPAPVITRRRALYAAAIAAVALVACWAWCRRGPTQDLYDLTGRLWLAERTSTREVVFFGTPSAERYAASGFVWELDGSAWAWVSDGAEMAFRWQEAVAREVFLDAAASPGNAGQRVSVSLNGHDVAALDLGETVTRQRFSLPAEAQQVGENRLRFRFAKTAPLSATDVRKMAARFVSVVAARADDASLGDLGVRGAPPMFVVRQEGALRSLVQVGPSSIGYGLALPERATLCFTPELDPVARGSHAPVTMRATIEAQSGGARDIWRRSLRGGEATTEVCVGLPGRAGEMVRLGLHVDAAPGQHFAWGVWRAPRVRGTRRTGEWAMRASSAEERKRGEPLRRAAAGANVLVIVLDAARAGHFGCYGSTLPPTPSIDQIAADGVVFERAYTPTVNTLGAISSLWTSQYFDAHHRGVSFLERLPRDRPTLAEILTARGVRTFGAVANAMAGAAMGLDRGFSEFREIYNDPELGSRAEVFGKKVHGWFAAHRQERFFAYLHFREPHVPFDPPAQYRTMFGPDAPLKVTAQGWNEWYAAVNEGRIHPTREEIEHLVRLYDGNLAYVDHEVGALRAALEAQGVWDRTLVIIMADHGDQLYEDGYVGHSAQVREESARVPLIVHFPAGRGPHGLRVPALVDLTDVAPTVAETFGIASDAPELRTFQGRSLFDIMGGAAGNSAVLVRSVWLRPVYALTDGEIKLVYDTRTGAEHLFDLVADHDERHDVAAAWPVVTAFSRQSLHQWVSQLLARPLRGTESSTLTPEQRRNLCDLGYISGADCP